MRVLMPGSEPAGATIISVRSVSRKPGAFAPSSIVGKCEIMFRKAPVPVVGLPRLLPPVGGKRLCLVDSRSSCGPHTIRQPLPRGPAKGDTFLQGIGYDNNTKQARDSPAERR